MQTKLLATALVAACAIGGMHTQAASAATMPAQAPMPAPPMNPMVGGAPMLASKDIVDNAVNSKDHTTLVAALKAADYVTAIANPGPFTVFAPTNAAFAKLPADTVDTLLKPENKAALTGVLTYHVVAGKLTSADLAKLIKAGGGSAEVTTVAGGKLTARWQGKQIVLTDAKGGKSTVTAANVAASNGVVHVIDAVLLPYPHRP